MLVVTQGRQSPAVELHTNMAYARKNSAPTSHLDVEAKSVFELY